MKAKERLYAVIGGCVGAVLTMVLCSFLPLGAQSQGDHVFGEITCRGIKVLNAENNEIISLGSSAKYGHGFVQLKHSDGKLEGGLMLTAGYGGTIISFSRDRKTFVLRHIEHGGEIYLSGDGKSGSVGLGVYENGGEVTVKGKNGGGVNMKVDKFGNGTVNTWEKNDYRQ